MHTGYEIGTDNGIDLLPAMPIPIVARCAQPSCGVFVLVPSFNSYALLASLLLAS
jgi:hypothetical protein